MMKNNMKKSAQIRTHPLFTCKMYPPFFMIKTYQSKSHAIHFDNAFMCTLVSFHVQCTIHMQCASILYSLVIHHMHNLVNTHQNSWAIPTVFTFWGDIPNLRSI